MAERSTLPVRLLGVALLLLSSAIAYGTLAWRSDRDGAASAPRDLPSAPLGTPLAAVTASGTGTATSGAVQKQETDPGFQLPFEGDGVLSLILSKAILLADDETIKDPTIVSQIRAK